MIDQPVPHEPVTGQPVTAALCIIGNEILSGRTQDKNLAFIAERLTALGTRLSEVRVGRVGEAASVEAVRALFEVNLVGAVNGLAAILPDMIACRRGRIAVVASVGVLLAHRRQRPAAVEGS